MLALEEKILQVGNKVLLRCDCGNGSIRSGFLHDHGSCQDTEVEVKAVHRKCLEVLLPDGYLLTVKPRDICAVS